MTTTLDLLDLTVDAIKGRTDVMDNVFSPRDWPTWSGSYPLILIQAPDEEKTSLGRNTPQFTVVATFRITARVQSLATPRDGGGKVAELKLLDLKQQIEVALVNSYQLTNSIQHFPNIRSQMSVSAEGELQIGELVMHVAMEFYQGPEEFYPVERFQLSEVTIKIPEPSGTVQPSLDIQL